MSRGPSTPQNDPFRGSSCYAQDDSSVVGGTVTVTLFSLRPARTVSGSFKSFRLQRSVGSVFNSPLTLTAFCFILRNASLTESARPSWKSNLSSLIRITPGTREGALIAASATAASSTSSGSDSDQTGQIALPAW